MLLVYFHSHSERALDTVRAWVEEDDSQAKRRYLRRVDDCRLHLRHLFYHWLGDADDNVDDEAIPASPGGWGGRGARNYKAHYRDRLWSVDMARQEARQQFRARLARRRLELYAKSK